MEEGMRRRFSEVSNLKYSRIDLTVIRRKFYNFSGST